MRDIRPDLLDRLRAIDAEIAELQKRMTVLDNQRLAVISLMDAESRRLPDATGTAKQDRLGVKQRPTLKDVIRELLETGEPWSTVSMAKVAIRRGCDFGGSSPGRALHATLLGMLKAGEVEILGEGRWRLRQQKPTDK